MFKVNSIFKKRRDKLSVVNSVLFACKFLTRFIGRFHTKKNGKKAMVGMDINQQSILDYFNMNRLQGLLEIMKENPNGKEKAHLKDIYKQIYNSKK